MGRWRVTTKRGYNLFDVASALQKSIRRGLPEQAGYFALELWASGYRKYVWKRLLVISAEDCAGLITQEVIALHDAFLRVNQGLKTLDKEEGCLFVAKAALLLATAAKCRDADHCYIMVYTNRQTDEGILRDILNTVTEEERRQIPEYAYDCHTSKGRGAGLTKADFLDSEFTALKPRIKGLFDGKVEEGIARARKAPRHA